MDVVGKNVFITGASRGIGRALAEKAASLKSNVHLVVREKDSYLKEELLNLGASSARTWLVDLSSIHSIKEMVQLWHEEQIDVDVLINNAGQLTAGLLESQSPESIIHMIQVNLTAVIYLSHAVLPRMLLRESGKIVNNTSVSGAMFVPCASTYAASKAGVAGFTKCLEQELKGTGVSTLLLYTPSVKTRMLRKVFDLYGGHLDLSFLKAVTPEEWADQVFVSIEKDHNVCWPKGAASRGLWLATNFPKVFNTLIQQKFHRHL